MDTMSYSKFKSQLSEIFDKVNDAQKPVLITRQNGKHAVIMSLEDFHSCQETAYLVKSPKNAKRLNQAIAQIEVGQVAERELLGE